MGCDGAEAGSEVYQQHGNMERVGMAGEGTTECGRCQALEGEDLHKLYVEYRSLMHAT